MSTRRAHTKSKSGCADCKRRRIKCDERRPDCGNCQKRGTKCSFQFFDPIPTSGSSIKSIHVFSSHQPKRIDSPPADGLLCQTTQQTMLDRLPEAERTLFKDVLRDFAAYTVPTLSPGTAAQAAWRKAVPIFAKQHDFVLHGVLAIGCLHLSSIASVETERDRYHAMAASQMNRGMAQYREEVQKVSTDNAEALLTFSVTFTTFTNYTTAAECKETLKTIATTATTDEEHGKLVLALVDTISRTFRAIRGALVILVPCWHHIRGGLLDPIVERDWWPPSVPVTLEEIDVDKRIRALETMWSHPGREYEYSFDTLRAALKSLREAFALVSRLVDHPLPEDTSSPSIFDWTSIFDWPVAVSLEFLSQLENQRMEAWVIVAHYAMLPCRIKDNLWMQGMGENMLSTAALVIGQEQWHWIEWPAAVIGIDLSTLRCTSVSSSGDLQAHLRYSALMLLSNTWRTLDPN